MHVNKINVYLELTYRYIDYANLKGTTSNSCILCVLFLATIMHHHHHRPDRRHQHENSVLLFAYIIYHQQKDFRYFMNSVSHGRYIEIS